MDDKTGDATKEAEVMEAAREKSEVERGWQSEGESWFQR